MSHPFGDLIAQHLHRKHGLSQSKLAAGILQSPSVITDMCQGKRLQGRQARERVVAITTWLQHQGVLETMAEANALLAAAGMAALRVTDPLEAALLQQISTHSATHHRSSSITAQTNLPTSVPRFSSRRKESATHNLPAQTTPLIGREQELAELDQLLTNPANRLVTILGAGGMGKTHLAVDAALNQVAQFANGVCWVALAPQTEANALVLAIGTALGLHFQSEHTPQQQVSDFLRAKQLLLVLDNFEHLLSCGCDENRSLPPAITQEPNSGFHTERSIEGAALLTELLAQAPYLSILVTSRQRLKLSSETVLRLEGLRFPTVVNADMEDYPAVALFLQHARRLRPHYQPTEKDRAGIVEICRLVDGMPLGILLATAWTGVISPTAIAAEIGKDLGFLQADLQDIPPRQRNLRALFLHTWSRLSNAERVVFMRLSVFRGGATREAAQRVTGASLAVLASLNDKALLWRLPSGRYEIHELLRQFAAEQLAADDADDADGNQGATQRQAHREHSRYYLTLLGEQEQPLQSQHQRAAITLIRTDFANISAAWHWAVDHHEFTLLAPAVHALFLFCETHSNYSEGTLLFAHAVAKLSNLLALSTTNWPRPASDQPTWQPLFVQLNVRLGACEVRVSNYATGERHLQMGLQLNSLARERAFALLYLGLASAEQGDLPLARTQLQEGLTISQQSNDWAGMAYALHWLPAGESDITRSIQLTSESLALWRKVGRPDQIADLLILLGWHQYCYGEYAQAKANWQEGLELCQQLESPSVQAWVLDCIGFAAWGEGDWVVAEQSIQKALAIYSDFGRQMFVGMCQAELALVLASMGRVEQALHLAQEAVATTRAVNGQMMLTVSLNYLGAVLITAGEYVAARHTLREAIQRGWDHEFFYNLMTAFYYCAELLVRESDAIALPDALERKALAMTLLSCVRGQPATWQVFKDKAAQLQAEIENALPAELRATAIARGQSCTLAEMVNTLLGTVETS